MELSKQQRNNKRNKKKVEQLLIDSNNTRLKGELSGCIGRYYRDKQKNLDKSRCWLLKASDYNILWARWEYFDILRMINTPESLRTMIEYGQSESDRGNMEVRARLARAYRDGKGVDKDLDKAFALYYEASNKGIAWAKNEMCDVLIHLYYSKEML